MRIGRDGRIALGGPTLARGYRDPVHPDPFAEAGWFQTNDIGALDSSGNLRVLGRADDAISTGGLTVLPGPVEAVLMTHLGVADSRLGQRVVAAVVVAGAISPTLDELRSHVTESLDTTAAPRELHVVAALPRRGIGKLDRKALVRRFSAD
jgi:O-succinylbenzoic acid--CoA ligase